MRIVPRIRNAVPYQSGLADSVMDRAINGIGMLTATTLDVGIHSAPTGESIGKK
jgi:hypothetical protein